ncbi:MAG: tRNA (adenosine(37)-N6)-threonylcarbamoyltransferase complex ATPase subunit type 1 TsaE [Bacteroidota bacterium]|nr:tRNA (adenosine(37)-N6)-threonylcarbamoyltransferase complex ATPase subunit type 1 TsaE [Bacteroidota bacterium]
MPDIGKEIPRFSLEDIKKVSKEIIAFAEDINIWIFVGEMGVGKTTLIKEICKILEVTDVVHSPTYSLVNEYETSKGEIFFHFDFYRLKDEAEAMDIGVDEYFYSGNTCFIEWPENIPSLLPDRHVKISISLVDKNLRSIFLSKHDQ